MGLRETKQFLTACFCLQSSAEGTLEDGKTPVGLGLRGKVSFHWQREAGSWALGEVRVMISQDPPSPAGPRVPPYAQSSQGCWACPHPGVCISVLACESFQQMTKTGGRGRHRTCEDRSLGKLWWRS